jgi:hypothetical protein
VIPRSLCIAIAATVALLSSGCRGDDTDAEMSATAADVAVEAPVAGHGDAAAEPTTSTADPVEAGEVDPALRDAPAVDPTQVPPPSPEEPPQGSMVPEPPPAY